MSCKFDKQIIQRYIDNEIEPLELIFLKEHIQYCADCKRDVELFTLTDQKIFDVCNNIELPFELDFLAEKVLDQCIEDSKNRNGVSAAMHRGVIISKGIAISASKFVEYIPGNKLIAKSLNTTTEFVSKNTKTFLKGRLKKVLGNIV
jgi:hypothetical protein